MNYRTFEPSLFERIVQAEQTSARGQVDVGPLAEAILPGVTDEWVTEAVRAYEARGWLNKVRRYVPNTIIVTLSGLGRKAAGR